VEIHNKYLLEKYGLPPMDPKLYMDYKTIEPVKLFKY